ncbi:MAG: hypothetical protein WAS21_01090 [Geminicoccaceae bacterium]
MILPDAEPATPASTNYALQVLGSRRIRPATPPHSADLWSSRRPSAAKDFEDTGHGVADCHAVVRVARTQESPPDQLLDLMVEHLDLHDAQPTGLAFSPQTGGCRGGRVSVSTQSTRTHRIASAGTECSWKLTVGEISQSYQ